MSARFPAVPNEDVVDLAVAANPPEFLICVWPAVASIMVLNPVCEGLRAVQGVEAAVGQPGVEVSGQDIDFSVQPFEDQFYPFNLGLAADMVKVGVRDADVPKVGPGADAGAGGVPRHGCWLLRFFRKPKCAGIDQVPVRRIENGAVFAVCNSVFTTDTNP